MEGCGRASHQGILCINCNIRMNSPTTKKRFAVLEQDTRVISLITIWISPRIITEEDYICEACFAVAVQTVNAELHKVNDQYVGPPLRGHKEVCLVCGRSLAKKQIHQVFYPTSEMTTLHTEIVEIIKNTISPREIQLSDRICHACYMRVKRSAIRNKEVDKSRLTDDHKDILSTNGDQNSSGMPENQEQLLVAVPTAYESSDITTPKLQPDQPSPPKITRNYRRTIKSSVMPKNQEQPVVSVSTAYKSSDVATPEPDQRSFPNTILRNYRRAPNTASHCIFYKCDNILSLHSISHALRRTLLINHKYYAPKHSKVCSDHLAQNSWHSLYDAENSMSSFTVEQIEHMLSFLEAPRSYLDFSSMASVEDIDNHLFQYYMGITKENFKSILSETPRVLEAHRGILGLASLLIKMRTGDSDERISILLQISRHTIERKMAVVREILLQTGTDLT